MFAATAAAITPVQVCFGGKHQQALFINIVINPLLQTTGAFYISLPMLFHAPAV